MVRIIVAISALALVGCNAGSSGEEEAETIDVASPAPEEEASESLDAMPEPFLGHWDFSEETCADPASEMRLMIAVNEIRYYESVAIPADITRDAAGALMVEHSFSGEGEEWTEMLAYELSKDGERLTVTQSDGSLSIRMRCPA